MKSLLRYLLTFFIWLGYPPPVSNATHIVGGDLTYRFVERQGDNNKYVFTLKIFYDCFPLDGVAALNSDTVITLAVYQRMTMSPELWRLVGNNGSLRMLSVRRQPLRQIANPTFECLVPPNNICVYEGIFEFELILKRIQMPYMITYQRCCRNNTITNLIQGGSTGASYSVELTPEAQELGNSTPVFNNYPPTIICINEPLVHDHSVRDPNNDRVRYSLCRATGSPGPLGPPGCFLSGPQNYNCPPPLRQANYYPQYPFERPMYGEPLVKIDSITGRITGTPVSFGQFVVSVCVEEWRGNVLMSRIFRDFQFNVVRCPRKVETALVRPDSSSFAGNKKFIISKCDSTTITILNNSKQTQFVNSFYWEFNIGGTTQRFNQWHPTISFPSKGVYRGILWVNRGEICYDSAYVDVVIGAGMEAKLGVQFDSCNAAPVNFINRTDTPYFSMHQMRWNLGDTVRNDWATNISHQYLTNGLKTATLTVTNRFGCSDDTTVRFEYLPMPNQILGNADSREGCIGAAVKFNLLSNLPDSLNKYRLRWDFGDGTIDTSRTSTRSHTYTRAGTFTPRLTVANLMGCQRSVVLGGALSIRANPRADFDFDPKVIEQGNEARFLDRSSLDVVLWQWRFGSQGAATGQNQTLKFQDTGSVAVRLFVRNNFNCLDSVTKRIFVEPFLSFHMPTAFTPNYDGLNDEFVGKGLGLNSLQAFSMKIVSRWGETVFETNRPSEGWNGKFQNDGAELPQGMYLYFIEYKNYVGKTTILKDYLQLVR